MATKDYRKFVKDGYTPPNSVPDSLGLGFGDILLAEPEKKEDAVLSYEQEEPEVTPPILSKDEIAALPIPENNFLLWSQAGVSYLQPSGFVDGKDFIVLFFESEAALTFRPHLRARFLGVYVLDSGERETLNLYYSGISFTLPESTKVVVIFHRTNLR